MVRSPSRGAIFGLAAAATFGVAAPVAKRLLGEIPPQLLAGILYGGAALVLTVAIAVTKRRPEARLRRSDAPMLVTVTFFGGVIAPVLLLLGLERVSAVAGSLLLNLEAVLTVVLALIVFGEHLDRRAAAGCVTIVVAAAVLGAGGGGAGTDGIGVLLVAAACGCWAIDNNLTQRLSGRDPFALVRFKATVAAGVNLVLAVVLGSSMPAVVPLIGALVLGGVAFGASVVLDAYALRWVGAAREAAYFATAPLFGVVVAVVLGDAITGVEAAAIVMMIAGVYGLVRERHDHAHTHEPLVHDHRHRHDDGHHDHHHDHPVGVHSHEHTHTAITHTHPHVSDAHHRHRHGHRGR